MDVVPFLAGEWPDRVTVLLDLVKYGLDAGFSDVVHWFIRSLCNRFAFLEPFGHGSWAASSRMMMCSRR